MNITFWGEREKALNAIELYRTLFVFRPLKYALKIIHINHTIVYENIEIYRLHAPPGEQEMSSFKGGHKNTQ